MMYALGRQEAGCCVHVLHVTLYERYMLRCMWLVRPWPGMLLPPLAYVLSPWRI
eukprot:jgi/Botrbrau1/22414/Bobra.0091s0019.1